MNKWGIIVSTYGDSKFRLTNTLGFLKERTKIPFDLWVRGASKDYWQQCIQREVADQFGAYFMESARWRHWEPANSFKTVKNPMLGFFKDDLIVGHNWLEAIDYFWENNPEIPIASVGCAWIEAWELVNLGILKCEDEMWDKYITIQRNEFDKLARSIGIKFAEGYNYDHPFTAMGTCPFAWTIKRQDFIDWNGAYYVGPGDNSVIYSHLGLLHGKMSFYIPYPTFIHRKMQSTADYCKDHNLNSLWDDKNFWYSEGLGEDFKKRWGITWKESHIEHGKLLNKIKASYNLDNLHFLIYK